MNIAGVLVHAKPGQIKQVEDRLQTIQGVEVHAKTNDNRLIVTIEDNDDRQVADTLTGLYQLEGVLSAAMVYQHCEDVDHISS